MSDTVLTFEQALAEVLQHARTARPVESTEELALADALGRVLAEPVIADRDQPPFDRSTRDGYALRSQDIGHALKVVSSLRAGQRWDGAELAACEAVEIMTGTALPSGADAVLMVEHAHYQDGAVQSEPGRLLRPGENVVARGSEAVAGDVVLPRGRELGAAEIAVAASCGAARLKVFARPQVAIVATGDELVELGEAMDAVQIRNSNSYALEALVNTSGGAGQRLGIARDTMADLRAHIAQGRERDLLLLTGGVSMGKYDFVEQALSEAGAEFFFTGALIQPGKPVVFGRLPSSDTDGGWTYFFGLPGNPVSTQVCFHLFVAPMLRALAGRTAIEPRFVEGRVGEDVAGAARVTRFLPAELTGGWDGVSVRLVGWQGSGDVAANARGNAYVVLPAGVPIFHAGETVRVLLR